MKAPSSSRLNSKITIAQPFVEYFEIENQQDPLYEVQYGFFEVWKTKKQIFIVLQIKTYAPDLSKQVLYILPAQVAANLWVIKVLSLSPRQFWSS